MAIHSSTSATVSHLQQAQHCPCPMALCLGHAEIAESLERVWESLATGVLRISAARLQEVAHPKTAMTDVLDMIDWSCVECLNQNPSHSLNNALKQVFGALSSTDPWTKCALQEISMTNRSFRWLILDACIGI